MREQSIYQQRLVIDLGRLPRGRCPNFRYPELRSSAWLRARIERGMTNRQIAGELGRHRDTVIRARHALGLMKRQLPPETLTARERVRRRMQQAASRPVYEITGDMRGVW